MKTVYTINTLHRGRLIQLLLGTLFIAGMSSSLLEINEMYKIIALLVTLPILLFFSVRFSQQPSTWTIDADAIHIAKGTNQFDIQVDSLAYIKNHIRSGGNLLVLFQKRKRSPLRFWRNKLFQSNDDFDAMCHAFKALNIPFMIG